MTAENSRMRSSEGDIPHYCVGGKTHSFVRAIRDHPKKAGKSQDRMICSVCDAVLYKWDGCFDSPKKDS